MKNIKSLTLSLFLVGACTPPAQVSKPVDNTIQMVDLNFSFAPDGEKLAVGLIGEPAHQGPVTSEMTVLEGIYTFSLQGTNTQKLKLVSHKGLAQSPIEHLSWSLDSQSLAYAYKATSGTDPKDYKFQFEMRTLNAIDGKQTSSATNCDAFSWTNSAKLNCLDIDDQGFLVWQIFDLKTGEKSVVRRNADRFDEVVFANDIGVAIPDIQEMKQINETQILFKTSEAYFEKDEDLWFIFDSSTGIVKKILNLNRIENLNGGFDLSLDKKFLFYDVTPQRGTKPGPLIDRSTGQIMKLSLDNNQEKVKIAQGIAPVVSPKGEQLAFLQGQSLMISDLSGANPKKILDKANLPTAYNIHKYHWHPTKNQILVVSAPDQKQLFTGGGASVFDFEYGVTNNISVDKLSEIRVYRIDLDTQKLTSIDLNWKQVIQDMKK